MHLGVLGPVEAKRSGRLLPVAGVKPRAVLTLLGLRFGEVVRAEALMELLWGEAPPRTVAESPANACLGATPSGRGRGGHDVRRWLDTRRGRYGRRQLHRRDRRGSCRSLNRRQRRSARPFRRGTRVVAGAPQLPDTSRGSAETTRWTEAHAVLVEDRADALLAAGRAAEASPNWRPRWPVHHYANAVGAN